MSLVDFVLHCLPAVTCRRVDVTWKSPRCFGSYAVKASAQLFQKNFKQSKNFEKSPPTVAQTQNGASRPRRLSAPIPSSLLV